MKNETTIRGLLALSSVTLCILLFFFLENERKFNEYKITTTKQMDSLSNKYDSLDGEHFQLNVEVGRHELTREEILSKYPNVKKEYEDYYEHQTE